MTSATTEINRAEASNEGPLSPELLNKMDAYWRAANYLSVGQIYLKDNPLLERPLTLDDVKPRLLGHWGTTPGLNFLYVHWNRIIRERAPGHDLRHRSGPRRPGAGGEHLSRGLLLRDLPPHRAESRRHQASLPPIQLALWNSQPRRAGDAGLDPRGRRAGLLAGARVRRGLRQSKPDRRLRGWRRRGRDRTAGHKLALQQIPQPGDRRRGAADPPPERLQDRQSDGAGAHSSCGT